MAIRDKLRSKAAGYLEPDESIQAVFPAQSVSQYMAIISLWIIIAKNAYRVIVVTDKRILVIQAGRFRWTTMKAQLREIPRQTKIGPASGLWYRFDSLGERLYVHRRFHKDVAAADGSPSS
jgi:hypothetical protein